MAREALQGQILLWLLQGPAAQASEGTQVQVGCLWEAVGSCYLVSKEGPVHTFQRSFHVDTHVPASVIFILVDGRVVRAFETSSCTYMPGDAIIVRVSVGGLMELPEGWTVQQQSWGWVVTDEVGKVRHVADSREEAVTWARTEVGLE